MHTIKEIKPATSRRRSDCNKLLIWIGLITFATILFFLLFFCSVMALGFHFSISFPSLFTLSCIGAIFLFVWMCILLFQC